MTDSAGANMGTEVANFYKSLLEGGLFPNDARDMTRDFASGVIETMVNVGTIQGAVQAIHQAQPDADANTLLELVSGLIGGRFGGGE